MERGWVAYPTRQVPSVEGKPTKATAKSNKINNNKINNNNISIILILTLLYQYLYSIFQDGYRVCHPCQLHALENHIPSLLALLIPDSIRYVGHPTDIYLPLSILHNKQSEYRFLYWV